MTYYYDPQGNPITQDEWIEKFSGDRIVNLTELVIDGRTVVVSTVYLGTDHNFWNPGNPPIIYETMVFGLPDGDEVGARYSTALEAKQGHQRHVKAFRDALGRLTLK